MSDLSEQKTQIENTRSSTVRMKGLLQKCMPLENILSASTKLVKELNDQNITSGMSNAEISG